MQAYYDYDIALSYAGEDRDRAKELAFCAERRGTRVFYDKDEAARLWGENLFTLLTDVYQIAHGIVSPCCRSTMQRSLGLGANLRPLKLEHWQKEPYLLPVRLDDSSVPGILPTKRSCHGRATPVTRLAELVLERLKGEQYADDAHSPPIGSP